MHQIRFPLGSATDPAEGGEGGRGRKRRGKRGSAVNGRGGNGRGGEVRDLTYPKNLAWRPLCAIR